MDLILSKMNTLRLFFLNAFIGVFYITLYNINVTRTITANQY